MAKNTATEALLAEMRRYITSILDDIAKAQTPAEVRRARAMQARLYAVISHMLTGLPRNTQEPRGKH